MKIATRFGSGAMTLAVFLTAQAFGQATYTTPEAQKAAAQLSQPAGPPMRAQSDTPNQQSDRTTVSGYGSSSSSAADNRPVQPLYENSAATGGQSMPMRDAQADNSAMAGQRDNGANNAANGQRRGEIGVWLVENGGQGVRVGRLARGGAAEQAGLRSGDIILQVNGNNVASPMTAAQQIRGIAIGQTADLTLLRDGAQQKLQVTLAAARPGQSYQVGYGGENENSSDRGMRSSGGDSGGLSARTAKLEQQMESMTEELRQMRQQMSSMRAGSAGTPGIGTEPSGAGTGTTPSALSPTPSNSTTPLSGAGSAASSSSSSPAAGSNPAGSSTPSSASSADKDLFGTGSSSSSSSTSPAGGTAK
jgi:membrane-associated protease RseP (regulator of RpoE activity)